MELWCRVFGALDAAPTQAGVAACLLAAGPAARIDWTASAEGWYRAEIIVEEGALFLLERWLAGEEGIRAELNAWAAYLETCEDSSHHVALMERAIQTRQLFTLRPPDDRAGDALVEQAYSAVCRHLAAVTEGFYQIDDRGFFAADGTLLVRMQ
jgi:hypothetical protein